MGIFDKLKKKKVEKKVSKKEKVVEVPVKKATEITAKPVKKTLPQSRANLVLLKTLVSEKATIAESKGKYTFVVANKTNKLEVKKAVKEIYGVVPEKVRMINVEGRQTRFGNKLGRQSDWKKAIVTLPKEKTINIHEGV